MTVQEGRHRYESSARHCTCKAFLYRHVVCRHMAFISRLLANPDQVQFTGPRHDRIVFNPMMVVDEELRRLKLPEGAAAEVYMRMLASDKTTLNNAICKMQREKHA